MSKIIAVNVPDIGNFKEVAVIEVPAKVGDRVAIDAPLLTLETEKATMDVPSSAAVRRIMSTKRDRPRPVAVSTVSA